MLIEVYITATFGELRRNVKVGQISVFEMFHFNQEKSSNITKMLQSESIFIIIS
jgi:hypothetical protein